MIKLEEEKKRVTDNILLQVAGSEIATTEFRNGRIVQ